MSDNLDRKHKLANWKAEASKLKKQLSNATTYLSEMTEERDEMASLLIQIGDYAHDHSTGPGIPDVLWEIRTMAYRS